MRSAIGLSVLAGSLAFKVDGQIQMPTNASANLTKALPSVSVVMPTNSRPEFVRRAVEMLARQDYPKHLIKEVVIVDDSPTALQATDLTQMPWPRIVYTSLEERRTVGRKRNIAAVRATERTTPAPGALSLRLSGDIAYCCASALSELAILTMSSRPPRGSHPSDAHVPLRMLLRAAKLPINTPEVRACSLSLGDEA